MIITITIITIIIIIIISHSLTTTTTIIIITIFYIIIITMIVFITFCHLPSVPAPSNRQVVLASKEVSNCGQSLHFISRRLRSTAWVISCFLFNDWDKSATRGPGLPVDEDDGSNDGDDANVDDGYDDDDDDDDDDPDDEMVMRTVILIMILR